MYSTCLHSRIWHPNRTKTKISLWGPLGGSSGLPGSWCTRRANPQGSPSRSAQLRRGSASCVEMSVGPTGCAFQRSPPRRTSASAMPYGALSASVYEGVWVGEDPEGHPDVENFNIYENP